jgi:hypothetical protein
VRKPAFPPHVPSAEAARTELLHAVRREPRTLGIDRTRWTVPSVLTALPWLRLTTAGGISRLLTRLGLSYKRGHRANTPTRVVATLEAQTGRVLFRRAGTTRVPELVQLCQHVAATYREASCVYVAQDNWPRHVHPDLLCHQGRGWGRSAQLRRHHARRHTPARRL